MHTEMNRDQFNGWTHEQLVDRIMESENAHDTTLDEKAKLLTRNLEIEKQLEDVSKHNTRREKLIEELNGNIKSMKMYESELRQENAFQTRILNGILTMVDLIDEANDRLS